MDVNPSTRTGTGTEAGSSTRTGTGGPPAGTGHPIVEFVDRLRRRLDELTAVPVWSMTPDQQRTALVDLHQAAGRLDELRLRVLAGADKADIAADTAATSTGSWLANATTTPRGAAHADVKLAVALDHTYAATRDALAAGHLDTDQARVIVHAVDKVRTEAADAVAADPSLPERAEKHLITLAADYDANTLKNLGRHVLEVLDPDAADEQLGKKLDAQEAAAARKTYLELHDNGDGTHSGRFKITDLHAAMLRKALETFTNPTHPANPANRHPLGADQAAPKRTRPELLGHAFAELLERLDPTKLPTAGGLNATVVILCDYDKLLTGLGTAHLDTGEPISAGLARRLACQAGIIPAVTRRLIDGSSVVLDMGRKRRLFTEHQRIALTIQQGGCTTDGCDRPAAWCHAHHDQPWSQGGRTDLKTGRLLCPFHHGKAHSPTYDTHHLPNGKIQFHRKT